MFIFENRGVEVGVTLHHPHGQIYGYPFLPPVPALELAADERLGGCAPCALLARELAGRAAGRVSRTSRARRLRSRTRPAGPTKRTSSCARTAPSLLDCDRRGAVRAGRGPAGARARLRRAVRAAVPLRDGRAPGAHRWRASQGHLHVEFYPPLRSAEKLKYLAGSEQGAGTFICDVLPEESAAALREAIARGG